MNKKTKEKQTIGLFPAHPSQVWILYKLEKSLSDEFNFLWFIRDKDISIELADELSISYKIVSKAKKGFSGNLIEFILNTFKLIKYTTKYRIDIWISKYSAVHIVAKILNKKSIFFIDDDYNLVPILYNLSCPFANTVLLPKVTNSGHFHKRLRRINGLFELTYLHPLYYKPNKEIYSYLEIKETQKYAIIRLASLSAHHDFGVKGVSEKLLRMVINLCEQSQINIFITSEKPITDEFENFRLSIPFSKIHDALFYAEFLLGDSQTMTSEAAILGTPAFRINSFVGKISCIAELEKLGLSFGFLPGQESQLIAKLKAFLEGELKSPSLKEIINSYDNPLEIFIDTVRALSN